MRPAGCAAIANGTVSMTPEIYSPGVGWRSLVGARSRDAFGPDYLRASYPRSWVAPNGKVVGISAETMWSLDVAGNGGTGAVTVLGRYKTAPSSTAPVNVGATNSAVMFTPGKVLVAGGNGSFNGDGLPARGETFVLRVDVRNVGPGWAEKAIAQLEADAAAADTVLNAERVRFRFQMEGLSPNWIDTGKSREARFPALPHGQYRFRVAASPRACGALTTARQAN